MHAGKISSLMYLVSLTDIIRCEETGFFFSSFAPLFFLSLSLPPPCLSLSLSPSLSLSLSGPPTRPKFGCNPSRAGFTLRRVTGSGEKASAFLFSEIECLSLCVFAVGCAAARCVPVAGTQPEHFDAALGDNPVEGFICTSRRCELQVVQVLIRSIFTSNSHLCPVSVEVGFEMFGLSVFVCITVQFPNLKTDNRKTQLPCFFCHQF